MTGRALIVDSGMRNLGGHNFSYTRAVQRALEARGIECRVLTHKALPVDLARSYAFKPTFTYGAYDFPPGQGWWSDLRSIYAQAKVFSMELAAAIDGEPYDFVFSHTLGDFELIGWERYLSSNSVRGKLVLLQRSTPYFRSANRLKLAIHPYWRIKPHCLNAIHRILGDRFLLVTDSEALSEDFAAIYRHRIATLPIPLPAHLAADDRGSRRAGRLRIGYLGDARPSKGFHLLPRLIARVLQDNEEVQFVIQCPPAASGTGDTVPGVDDLRAMESASGGRVILIQERLDEQGYAELMRSLDAVLIPYLRAGYIAPTSGILAEAMALGRPVIVPSGTWMSRELGRTNGGVVFESGDVDDLIAKVRDLISGYDVYARRAQEGSAVWRAFHNAENLVTILLEKIGVPSTSDRAPVASGVGA